MGSKGGHPVLTTIVVAVAVGFCLLFLAGGYSIIANSESTPFGGAVLTGLALAGTGLVGIFGVLALLLGGAIALDLGILRSRSRGRR